MVKKVKKDAVRREEKSKDPKFDYRVLTKGAIIGGKYYDPDDEDKCIVQLTANEALFYTDRDIRLSQVAQEK